MNHLTDSLRQLLDDITSAMDAEVPATIVKPSVVEAVKDANELLDRVDRLAHAMADEGYEDGRDAGYDEGYEDGEAKRMVVENAQERLEDLAGALCDAGIITPVERSRIINGIDAIEVRNILETAISGVFKFIRNDTLTEEMARITQRLEMIVERVNV